MVYSCIHMAAVGVKGLMLALSNYTLHSHTCITLYVNNSGVRLCLSETMTTKQDKSEGQLMNWNVLYFKRETNQFVMGIYSNRKFDMTMTSGYF